MRVFVTGATGFLGGALARALVQQGAEVHALCRPTSERHVEGITWHEGDVTLPETLSGPMAGADWIIHAAGKLGEAGVPVSAYQRLNVGGTRSVLRAAFRGQERPRLLHLSSPGVLGPTPAGEAAEDAPYAASNPYEQSKADAERVAMEFAARGLPVLIARPGFIYGPGDRHVLGLFRAVLRGRFFYVGGGRHVCQPTFVDDAVEGMLLCLRTGRPGRPYHVTGPRPVTFRELGETIADALGVPRPWLSLPRWLAMLAATGLEWMGMLTGRSPPLSRNGVAFFSEDRVYSWRRAHDELGYTPVHDFAQGVARTVGWYRERGWL